MSRTKGKLNKLLVAQNNICPLCEETILIKDATFDHIIPISKGGTDTTDNLRVTHSICNGVRGNNDTGKTVEYYLNEKMIRQKKGYDAYKINITTY